MGSNTDIEGLGKDGIQNQRELSMENIVKDAELIKAGNKASNVNMGIHNTNIWKINSRKVKSKLGRINNKMIKVDEGK